MTITLESLNTVQDGEGLPTSGDIYEASLDALIEQSRLAPGLIEPTVGIVSSRLSRETGVNVNFFSEVLQNTGAFKINGAFNFLRLLEPEERQRGVITASAGNHAAGVAAVAAFFGVPARLVMPQTTPQFKIDNCISAGDRRLEIELHGKTFDEAAERANILSESEQLTFVPPFDHLHIIAGQAVVAHHILGLASGRGLDKIYVPIGGGGLIAGVSSVFRELSPNTRVIGVEPEGANAMCRSLDAGRNVEINNGYDSRIDGAAVRRPGDLPFAICHENGVGHRTVSFEEVCEATVALRESGVDALAAELVASTSFAGLLRDLKSGLIPAGSRVGVLITGGQLSPTRYQDEVKIKCKNIPRKFM